MSYTINAWNPVKHRTKIAITKSQTKARNNRKRTKLLMLKKKPNCKDLFTTKFPHSKRRSNNNQKLLVHGIRIVAKVARVSKKKLRTW